MQKKRLPSGTIFWEKYKGYYYFFKVILDFKDVTKRGYATGMTEIFYSNYNDFFKTSPDFYLVQVFSGRYDNPNLPANTNVLINGVKITNDFQKKRYYEGEGWEVYEKQEINIKSLDIYEDILQMRQYGRGNNWFYKGNLGFIYQERFKEEYGGTSFFETTELCELAGHLMGFHEASFSVLDNYNNDLRRHPELRKQIYEVIGEDPNMSWYELSLKRGFDLNKLFEERELNVNIKLQSEEKTQEGYPLELLQQFSWSFDRNPLKTMSGFKRAMLEYNDDFACNDLSPFLESIIFPFPKVVLQYEVCLESENDDEDEETVQIVLETENEVGFTLLEFTYQMQLKIGKGLKKQDHVFLEGLTYATNEDPDFSDVPVYFMNMGS